MKFKLSILCALIIIMTSCKDEVKEDNKAVDTELKNETSSAVEQEMYAYCEILESEIQLASTDMETYHIAETGINSNVGLSAMIYMDVNTMVISQIDFESKNDFKNVKTATFKDIEGDYVLEIVLHKAPGDGDVLTSIKSPVLNDLKPKKSFKTIIDINEEGLQCEKDSMLIFIPLKKGHSFKRPSLSSGN